jgi:hypothetical protein
MNVIRPTNLIPFPYQPTWIQEHTLILSLILSLSHIPFENFPSLHYIIFHRKSVQNIIYQIIN